MFYIPFPFFAIIIHDIFIFSIILPIFIFIFIFLSSLIFLCSGISLFLYIYIFYHIDNLHMLLILFLFLFICCRHRLAAFELHKGRCPITMVKFNPQGNMMFYAMSYDWCKGADHNDPKVGQKSIKKIVLFCFILFYFILFCEFYFIL